jgi:hypothetical protein
MAIEVRGLKETLQEIRNLDKMLFNEIIKDLKNTAKPYETKIKEAFPTKSPLKGAVGNGRTNYNQSQITVKTKFSNRRPKGNRASNLLKVVVEGNVGAVIFDLAGKKNPNGLTRSGKIMIAKLRKSPSRYVWPAAEQNFNLIEKSIVESILNASKIVNKNLLTNPKKTVI